MADPSTPSAPKPEEPGQLAIALRQDSGASKGSRVVATGRGHVAEQILAIAFDRGVKVRTDADLAEILAAVELDSEVPVAALAAVAEILTYVYRASHEPVTEAAP